MTKLKFAALLSCVSLAPCALAQSRTLLSGTGPAFLHTDNDSITSPVIIVIPAYSYNSGTFTFGVMANNYCIGDNPSPGPTWDSPWTSYYFYNAPVSLDISRGYSNAYNVKEYATATVTYTEVYGSETWIYNESTQASRSYDVVSNAQYTVYLTWPGFGGGGVGGG